MNIRILPEELNDGNHEYIMVSQEKDCGDGIKQVALYEKVPMDEQYQYTPDLSFIEGLSEIPIMHKILRK